MVRRRDEFPEEGELIVGTVKEINPNSVFVVLDEYNKEGMIHISEIAKKWVRDIRDWVSIDKKIVCKVKEVRKEKDQIDLSLKKVDDRDKNRRMQTWKRDERGEEFLKKLAERKDMNLDEIYENIGFDIQDKFRDMLEPFEIAVRKGSAELGKRGLSDDWIEDISEVGEESIKIKEEKLSEYFYLNVWESQGADIIRDVLSEISKEHGVEFKYISAPKYEIVKKARNLKRGQKSIQKSLDSLRKKLEGHEFKLREDTAR